MIYYFWGVWFLYLTPLFYSNRCFRFKEEVLDKNGKKITPHPLGGPLTKYLHHLTNFYIFFSAGSSAPRKCYLKYRGFNHLSLCPFYLYKNRFVIKSVIFPLITA
uniref:Uncharacterized protein n=1 Tax=Porodaedalea pini TaxID=108901 RepID=A0A5B9RJR2_9AGAM|nr:hypothetical protein PPIT_000103 [Porodaedalea pini]QEG56995.1 hypothetical protein PPIT_000103 [Porodaedalea pini]